MRQFGFSIERVNGVVLSSHWCKISTSVYQSHYSSAHPDSSDNPAHQYSLYLHRKFRALNALMIGQNTAFGTKIMGGDTGIPFIFYKNSSPFHFLLNRAASLPRAACTSCNRTVWQWLNQYFGDGKFDRPAMTIPIKTFFIHNNYPFKNFPRPLSAKLPFQNIAQNCHYLVNCFHHR